MAHANSTIETVEYREIPGFPGYRVGSDGSVWSRLVRNGPGWVPGSEWRRLSSQPRGRSPHRGHLKVILAGGKRKMVHALVLEAFVGPKPAGMECRHLDGVCTNNAVSNLAWGTRLENYRDQVRHGVDRIGRESVSRVGSRKRRGTRLDEASAGAIMRLRIETGLGCKQITESLGLPPSSAGAVRDVIRGRSWNHVTGLPVVRTDRPRL